MSSERLRWAQAEVARREDQRDHWSTITQRGERTEQLTPCADTPGVYPRGLQIFVECPPLYQGIEIVRGLVLGSVEPALFGRAAYLAIVGAVGLAVSSRQLGKMLLS